MSLRVFPVNICQATTLTRKENRTFTFWRFMIEIPLTEHEMRINYTINKGIELNFHVPGRNQNMRWAAYSVRSLPSIQ